ncbi:hypothetical protein CHCC5025_1172 [Bacillus licheniformis]|nr:hypothetical protein CHCC5025_1172 [Bacillus licheniformis]TWJ82601.1 hypothetical protein CHCC20497_2071 [Bacillus paralicheniformis]
MFVMVFPSFLFSFCLPEGRWFPEGGLFFPFGMENGQLRLAE